MKNIIKLSNLYTLKCSLFILLSTVIVCLSSAAGRASSKAIEKLKMAKDSNCLITGTMIIIDGVKLEDEKYIPLKKDSIFTVPKKDVGSFKILTSKEAILKYGERFKYGVIEILTNEYRINHPESQ